MQLLHYRESGESPAGDSPLLFLHGLFGSASNWGRVVTHFSARHRCIVPDLRNHGRSFHAREVGYPVQAADLLRLLDHLVVGDGEAVSLAGKHVPHFKPGKELRDRVDGKIADADRF